MAISGGMAPSPYSSALERSAGVPRGLMFFLQEKMLRKRKRFQRTLTAADHAASRTVTQPYGGQQQWGGQQQGGGQQQQWGGQQQQYGAQQQQPYNAQQQQPYAAQQQQPYNHAQQQQPYGAQQQHPHTAQQHPPSPHAPAGLSAPSSPTTATLPYGGDPATSAAANAIGTSAIHGVPDNQSPNLPGWPPQPKPPPVFACEPPDRVQEIGLECQPELDLCRCRYSSTWTTVGECVPIMGQNPFESDVDGTTKTCHNGRQLWVRHVLPETGVILLPQIQPLAIMQGKLLNLADLLAQPVDVFDPTPTTYQTPVVEQVHERYSSKTSPTRQSCPEGWWTAREGREV